MTANLITLDNLSEHLTPWSPTDENHIYAIVDMGSNGIRFSITSLQPPRSRLLQPLYSERASISLFDALTPSPAGHVFPEATIKAVSEALSGFRRRADQHGTPASHTMVLATEAMRRASNARTLLDAIAKATGGLQVRVLDPAAETLLGAVMGSRSGLVSVDNGALFLDLGGGSVQMTWVDTTVEGYEREAAQAGISLPFGAAKLSRLLEEGDAQTQASELHALRSGLRQAYENLCLRFPALKALHESSKRSESPAVSVYMCGGGSRGYGSMLMHADPVQPYPIPSVATYSVDAARFKQSQEMRIINDTYQDKIFGMSKRRRQQFPAIATVMEAFIEAVPHIERVTFCGGSNREGALMMKLPPHIRESNPLDILAGIQESERSGLNSVLRILLSSLPTDSDLTGVPTIFSLGLGQLFVREAWSRHGHDADSNSSFALHNAISLDTNIPGLTHMSRAMLALSISARWDGNLGPADSQLLQSLRLVVGSYNNDAVFWAQYIGALCSLLAAICPAGFSKFDQFESQLNIDCKSDIDESQKNLITLTIEITADIAKAVDLTGVIDRLKAASKGGPKILSKKVSPKFVMIMRS